LPDRRGLRIANPWLAAKVGHLDATLREQRMMPADDDPHRFSGQILNVE
jgi:hypothetical protein